MKSSQVIKLIILLFCSASCANKNPATTANDNNVKDTIAISNTAVPDSFEAGKVIGHIACKNDAAQSYALYIPAKGSNEALPVIYFFDPHGDGSFPLKKYRNLSDAYDFILIGSNNSKNGNDWSATENIWRSLFDDTQKRLKINSKRVYTCGFSGGAKVAGYLALHNDNVKGVIANGAAFPDETPADNYSFSFTAIAGEGDMNMTDLAAISNELDKTQTRHCIIFFDGKHEWAPESIMNTAFAGLQLDAIREKLIPKDDGFINNYIFKSKKKFDEYYKTNNLIKAERECKLSVSLIDGLTTDVNWFKEKDASLENNTAYQKQWQAQQNLLITEQNMKAQYVQQFQNGDMNYWTKTISDLQTRAKVKSNEGAMYQRLLAYLSLAFYSISNQLIANNRNGEAQQFVELYKMVDSTNSEAWYFSAILNARNNNAKATEHDLIKAVENGFADKNRMEQQSEFQGMATQINFSKIEGDIKKE